MRIVKWIDIVLATGLAFGPWMPRAAGADRMPDADFKKAAVAPASKANHVALAKHYRALMVEHEAEAKMYESLASGYQKGLPGITAAQARDLTRAAKHAAQHARDFAEAIEHLAEAHEGYSENMK